MTASASASALRRGPASLQEAPGGGRSAELWVLLLTSAAAFMVSLDSLAVTTVLPAMGADLGVGLGALQWTVSGYGLACAAGIAIASAVGERAGRRRVFTGGIAGFTAASAACALAPSAEWLVAARVLQGLGAAVVLPLGMTLLSAAFPPSRRGTALGLWAGVNGVAVAAGPLVGGLVTQAWDWRAVFWLNVPLGVAATVLGGRRLRESRAEAPAVDVPAVALLSLTALGLTASLARAGSAGWADGGTRAGLAATAVVLAALVAWERRARAPLLSARLLRTPGFTPGAATAFLMAGAVTGAAFLVASYLQTALGASPSGAGARLLPWTAAPLLVSPVAGWLSDRLGRRRVLVSGMALQAAGLAWLAGVAAPDAAYRSLVAPLLVAGVGIALAVPTAVAATLHAVVPTSLGPASGVATTLQRLGGAVGVALVVAVFTASAAPGAAGFVAGFRPALAVAAALSLAGAVTALGVDGRRDGSDVRSPAVPRSRR